VPACRRAEHENSRVRADNIQAPEFRRPRVKRIFQGIVFADISLSRENSAIEGLDHSYRFCQVGLSASRVTASRTGHVGSDINTNDICTLFGETNRMAASLPSRSACDGCDFLVKPAHAANPP
jgi:hypothetical protein